MESNGSFILRPAATVAEKTYDEAQATQEDAPVSLYLDSPYQISKIIGELYSNYYFLQHRLPVVKARFQNVYGPGEILGAQALARHTATVWRNVTPTFIYRGLKRMPLTVENQGVATRELYLRRRHCARANAVRDYGQAWGGLQPRERG